MKRICNLFFLICFSCIANPSKAETISREYFKQKSDTSSYPIQTYLQIDLNSYVNRSVNEFLNEIPLGYLISPIYSEGNLRYASRLNIYYASNVSFVIRVREFTHMNPYSFDRNWDFNLFKLEKIFRIQLYEGSTCLNGCD